MLDSQNREIERKFLVLDTRFKTEAKSSEQIIQGYIFNTPQKNLRIRIYGNKAYLTIKGSTEMDKLGRFEWEQEVSLSDARQLFNLCEPGYIDKTRYLVDYEGHTFEVDEFHGIHEGLIIAEIELKSEDELFDKPIWLGEEVTHDPYYYNAQLIRQIKD